MGDGHLDGPNGRDTEDAASHDGGGAALPPPGETAGWEPADVDQAAGGLTTFAVDGVGDVPLPAAILKLGPDAACGFVEFFAARIRNANTRAAYLRNAVRFLAWIERRGLPLPRVSPTVVALYVERLTRTHATASVKQHLATLRVLGDFLVEKRVIEANPAQNVRGPRHVVRVGKTPVLEAGDVRRLFDGIAGTRPADARDRALLAVMLYTFGRVSAVVGLDEADVYQAGRRVLVRLREKGGRQHEMPLHHRAVELLDAYRRALDGQGEAAGAASDAPPGETAERDLTRRHGHLGASGDGAVLPPDEGTERVEEKRQGDDAGAAGAAGVPAPSPPPVEPVDPDDEDAPAGERVPLFRSLDRRGRPTGRRLSRRGALAAVKRRCRAAGLGDRFACHSLRASGITAHLTNGGQLEHAQRTDGHAKPETTQLHDRRGQAVGQAEVERIRF